MKNILFEEYARRGFLRDLLHNNITSVKDIWNLQKQLNINTQPNTAVAITVDNYHSITRNKSEIQKQNLRLRVLKSIEEASVKFDAMAINMEEDLYAVLFYMESSEIEPVEKAVSIGKYLQEYVETKTGVSVTVGIGRRYKDVLDLHLSYKDALLACHHKFFIGKSQVIHIENIVPFFEGLELFSIEVESQLSVKILSCDKDGAFEILDELLGDALEGKFINPIIMKTRLIEIITTIVRVGLEAGVEQEKLAILSGRFVQEVLKSDTILDLRNQMREVIYGVIEEISQGRKHMNLQVFEEAIEYINDNFDKDITLEDVSGHVHISPYYFSHGFKKFTGMTFIEYLTKIRIKEAKKLLFTTDLNIGEIGKQVGYGDPNYFGRVFKNMEGMPPSKFKVSKKIHI
ncbi:MAG: helix-turn-helix transcriptional regulator [Tepidanaerobacter acetatoxydans]|uniref:helix-turn-helix domain-containing protein n=1 Tax=Tepidanaerobacter acetatoxydans TaxID=499229 RepID=UPI0026EF494D|nr:helix-turn-helix domain-containing protein [Tepidanaerobacter acetatoxydans]NLU11536.1 helix-turn-helix transcriptional regulator [Tepidanaerobacter acetatoxydans]